MRYIIALLGVIAGCGSVSSAGSDGAAGSGSQGGTAGLGTGGSAGMGGAGGAAGTTGAGGSASKPCDDTCDLACNACVSAVCTPKTDNTVCGSPECGGAPLITNGYTASSIGYKHVCRAGTCVKAVNVDCTTFACTTCTQPPSAPGCFDYDDLGNGTGTTECRCVENGRFCPK